MRLELLLLLLLLLHAVVSSFNFSEIRNAEYCERQTFRADCTADDRDKNKVVVMAMAKYGRSTRPSKCGGISTSDCDINVIDLFDQLCSGRRSCEVRVSSIIDSIPDNQMLSCLRDFRGFLEASYACVPVISRTPAECAGHRALIQLTEPTGYLANVVTEESGCGSLESPWILEAPSGQTIHLRLIDFASSLHDSSYPRKSCDVYLIVKEKPFSASNTICSIEQKEQNVFVSESNKIEVRIGAQTSSFRAKEQNVKKKYFLLKYTLQGCPDIPGGNGKWVERIGAVSVVGCNGTSERHQLTCQSNSWVGELPECLPSYWGGSPTSLFWSVFTDSQWIAIATILGIALIIGVIIFLAGIICIRKRRQVQSYGGQVCASPRCMAEYHLARCDPTAYARHGSTTPKSLSLDLLGGASLDGSNVENDYFRTWQLQRNAFNNMRCPNIPTSTEAHLAHFVPSSMAYKPIALSGQIDQDNDGIDFEGFRRQQTLPLVEHIYESPKFDRKEYSLDCYATSNPQTIQHSEDNLQDCKITEETICSQKS